MEDNKEFREWFMNNFPKDCDDKRLIDLAYNWGLQGYIFAQDKFINNQNMQNYTRSLPTSED